MAGLMYFVPDVTAAQLARDNVLSSALLKSRGLDEVLSDRMTRDLTAVFDLTTRGPGDLCGAMIIPLPNNGDAPPRMMYEPTCQDWYPDKDPKQLWIGRDKSLPPLPAELERSQRTAGYDVKLKDGQLWHVPIVRRPGGSSELPRSVRFDAQDKLILQIERRYEAIWNDMAAAVDLLCGFGGNVELEPYIKLAIRVLGINYRFGVREQNVYELVDSNNWQDILEAAIDWPLIAEKQAEAQKKRALAEATAAGSTPPGQPAGSPTTDQATAT